MNSLLFVIVSLFPLSQVESADIPHYWLPEIVITAKRIREPLSEVAVDMRVITEDEIIRKGVRTVEALLEEEGFLDIRTTGVEGGLVTIGLRGFPADQFLVLHNGIVLNSPANGCFDFSEIPLSSIKRLEIVKSPVSSIYGANASSGVINIITYEEEKEGVSIGGNSNILREGAKHVFAQVASGRGTVGTKINISKRISNGARSNSKFNSISGGGNISILNLINTEFSLGERKVGVPGPVPPPDSIPEYGGSDAYSLFDNQKAKHLTGSLNIEKSMGDFSVYSSIGYRKENLWFSRVYEGYYEDWSIYKRKDYWYYITEQITGSIQFSYKDISSGIDILQQEFWAYDSVYDAYKDSLVSITSWNPNRETKAFWTSVKQRFFNSKVIPSASIRWDKNSDYPNFFSYSGGLLFNIRNNIRIGSSFGKGFRAPTFNELYWPLYGNDSLKPEESFQRNIFIDTNLNKLVFVRLSGFWREVKNSISWIEWKPENIDRVTVKGIEINPTINPLDFISLSFSLVMKKTTEERAEKDSVYHWCVDGNLVKKRRVPYTPEKKFTGSIEFRARSNTFITFTSIYTGEKIAYFFKDWFWPSPPNYVTKKISHVTLYNLNIYQKLGEKFSLSLRIDNLFNEKYKTNFGYTLGDGDYPGPGRSISLGFHL